MNSEAGSQPNTKPSAGFPVTVGQVLAGKYRVENVLGIGGMGLVVAAQHVQLGQRVALKFLNEEVCALPQAVDRFMREARASVQIQSEHVARVTDVGQLENGSPYIVMEYLEGTDLAAVLRQRGPLPVEEAVDYVLQAAEAIAVAHRLRIVHRDLKPANLFLTQRPDESALVKVLDFGISKALDGSAGALSGLTTNSSVNVIGSPLYMSPEQFKSAKDVDTRSDIWALGVIIHELVTGEYPFHAETLPQLFAMVLTDPPKKLREVRPELPEELEQIVLRCLEKDIDKRYQQVGELANALAPFAPSEAKMHVERIRRVATKSSIPPRSASQPPSASNIAVADANPTLRTKSSPPLASTPSPVQSTLAMATPSKSVPPSAELANSNATTDAKAWGTTQPPKRGSFTIATAALSAIIPLTILTIIGFTIHWAVTRTSSTPAAATSAPAATTVEATAAPEPTPTATPEPLPTTAPEESAAAASAAPATSVSAPAAPTATVVARPTMTAASAKPTASPAPVSDGFSDRK